MGEIAAAPGYSQIRHMAKSPCWATPLEVVEAARKVLGTIDLDPATSKEWNQARVRAARFYTKDDDGLSQPWSGSVFLNPPGGKVRNKSLSALFWAKLMASVAAGEVTHAIYVAFSLEQLQTTQSPGQPGALQFPVCVPAKRLRFVNNVSGPAKAPTNASAIVYVPGTVDRTSDFIREFTSFGSCR